jgi:THO complex subunit 5
LPQRKHRQISTALDSRRRILEQHKECVDSLHLQLENLLYKKAYLLREIRECRDFTTPALQAVESDTSKKIASLQFSTELSRQHQQALEFLETEMELREHGKAALEEKKHLYAKRETELDGRRKILDELPGRITRVEAAVSSELNPIFDVV